LNIDYGDFMWSRNYNFFLFFILQNYDEFVNTKWYKKKTFENKWWSLDLKNWSRMSSISNCFEYWFCGLTYDSINPARHGQDPIKLTLRNIFRNKILSKTMLFF